MKFQFSGIDEHIKALGMTPRDLFGSEPAYELAVSLIEISNIWDDFIDGDHVAPSEINAAFYACLIEIPANQFYRQHWNSIHALMQNAILQFLCANRWENDKDPHGLELGHVLRYGVAHVVAQIVILAKGVQHAADVLPALYKALCGDRVEDYRAEIMKRGVINDG